MKQGAPGRLLESGLDTTGHRIAMAAQNIGGHAVVTNDEVVEIKHEAEVTVGIPVQPAGPHRLLATAHCRHGVAQAAVQVGHTVTAGEFQRAPVAMGGVKCMLDTRCGECAFLDVVVRGLPNRV